MLTAVKQKDTNLNLNRCISYQRSICGSVFIQSTPYITSSDITSKLGVDNQRCYRGSWLYNILWYNILPLYDPNGGWTNRDGIEGDDSMWIARLGMMSRVHCLFRSTLRHPRLPKIWARALLWWSGFSKLRVEPPKHSLRGTAYLRRIPRFRVWTLTHLVYPSAGGLHS